MIIYWFNERFGRRLALIGSGMVFNIGTIFQVACNGNVGAFYAGRIIAGLGVGGISFVVPQYLSECSPAVARGAVVGAVSDDFRPSREVLEMFWWLIRCSMRFTFSWVRW